MALHVEALYYSNVSGGLFDGQGAVTVELGNRLDLSPVAVIASISRWLEKNRSGTRLIRLLGSYWLCAGEDLRTLLSTLREQGFTIAAHLRGKDRPEWVEQAHYRVALIGLEPWLMYPAQEVRWMLTGKEKAEDRPILGAMAMTKGVFFYVVPAKDTEPGLLVDLMGQGWRLLLPPIRTYRVPITIVDEEEKPPKTRPGRVAIAEIPKEETPDA